MDSSEAIQALFTSLDIRSNDLENSYDRLRVSELIGVMDEVDLRWYHRDGYRVGRSRVP